MTEPTPANGNVINGIARTTLAAGGGATMVAAHDELIQLLGLLVTAVSLAWSIYEKTRGRGRSPLPPAALLAVLSTLMLPGCATAPSAGQLATITAVAEEAAYVGTALRLEKAPGSAAQFGVALAALDALAREERFTPGDLQAALANLPALAGASGAIIESGSVLFILTTGFIDLDAAPRVRAAVAGITAGIRRGLARAAVASGATGRGSAALLPPLPTPCVVPARRGK